MVVQVGSEAFVAVEYEDSRAEVEAVLLEHIVGYESCGV